MNAAAQTHPSTPTAEQATLRTRRRLRYSAAACLGVLALLALAGYWLSTGRYLESTDDAYIRADWVALSSRVAGYVATVEVEDDQPVEAGAVLVRLQDRDYQARRDRARAAEHQAQAAIDAARARRELAVQRIEQQAQATLKAEAAVHSASAERRRSQLDLQRYQGLVRDEAATTQRLEQALAAANQAKAVEQGAKAAWREQQAQQRMAKAGAAQAEADLQQHLAAFESARAERRLAEQDAQDTVLRAPVAGVVGKRHVRAGQYVVPGQPLLAVVPVAQAYVVANYKETQLARMRPGQPVQVEVDSFPGQAFEGHVESFSPASGNVFALLPSDNATGNFTKIVQRFAVRILLDLPVNGPQILPGMSVVTTVDTRTPEPADAR
ncbi:HlyD family secretion protein [Pseudomonas fulva]|uniref:HlyD family secretion protein n=1 Tax=Pseudomonas TaxID=286 RepID=UPI000B50423C|nr:MULTISPECIES: HlyD family secretion protein [Pseudomonas]MBA1222185.1 HlyD family secretion protein [Pseudomonas fulva]MBN4167833.1 HlyD family secretion protein [Pseudomonas fulva]MCP3791328.1 HlyD family secretion protein [Pseudomonas sp. N2-11]TFA88305.1 membrane fusion protein (multidrug efflux system) [Pseudomonas sp. URIL14HWK12:I1]SNB66174.1 membrane fusion protein, multidrug efflux system [Pseudomonas sp. LAIL14HWK12:I4]